MLGRLTESFWFLRFLILSSICLCSAHTSKLLIGMCHYSNSIPFLKTATSLCHLGKYLVGTISTQLFANLSCVHREWAPCLRRRRRTSSRSSTGA